ncbi:MAG: hypothetical protein DI549_06880 [Ancylobacter novellus]|uniref:Tlde1 domain-containing protein n=1 Tax=Ancylobacter novellus TaxID=921 RepID=A0A2W5SLY9_ANCNO|nr:MAG: hypothetical protein DI549_06880 [Ancylobacter novellus]
MRNAAPRFVGTFLIGSVSFVAMAVAVAWVSNAFVPTPADAARVDPELRLVTSSMAPVDAATAPFNAAPLPFDTKMTDVPAAEPVRTVLDVRNFHASGELAQAEGWLFDPAIMPVRPAVLAALPPHPPVSEPTVEVASVVPLPVANPLFAGRVMSGNEPDDELTLAPLPPKKPGIPTQAAQAEVAMLPPPMEEDMAPATAEPPAATVPQAKDELRYPTAEDKFAIYDIRAKKLYLPNGKKLEAHSGYGDKFDDVRYVHVKMYGPTPPNRYKLKMREALFHGTEAVRMTPVGDGKMYGRNGILLHPYLLGPRGDSNGCVSVADYDAFLASFKRGEVEEVIVVESMPKTADPANPLISWLTGKRS